MREIAAAYTAQARLQHGPAGYYCTSKSIKNRQARIHIVFLQENFKLKQRIAKLEEDLDPTASVASKAFADVKENAKPVSLSSSLKPSQLHAQ